MKLWFDFLEIGDFIFESQVRDKCGKCGCFTIKGTISSSKMSEWRFDGIL